MTQQWLKCKVSKGLFSDERLITVEIKGNRSVDEFVPADQTRGGDRDGRVRVSIGTINGVLWAVLPAVYSESVPINPTQLMPA